MTKHQLRRQHVLAELRLARDLRKSDPAAAFSHLERAHVLSQAATLLHVRTHLSMARWAWAQRDWREFVGQLPRVLAAGVFSTIWVPAGNTGGARVSAFEPMGVEPELADLLKSFLEDEKAD